MTAVPQPLSPQEPLPHRKVIREWLTVFEHKQTLTAFLLLAFDFGIYFALMAGVVWFEAWIWKLLCGLAAGFVIGRLFIIGHDACHQSLTPHRRLNRVLGRLAFLASLTPYSLWDIGHNMVHHGYTNLKGVDFVWAPKTREEFEQLSASKRVLERMYRSGWAPWLYYLIEIWWLRMYFPSKTYMGAKRAAFTWDGILVSVYAALWMGALVAAAVLTQQSIALILLLGFVVPFIFWNAMIGFVVYVHHTHVRVSWHDDKKKWADAQPFVSTTVHLTFPFNIGALMHHIMEHTAHHVSMAVPLYQLKKAQQWLEDAMPGRIIVQRFSWRWYFETARHCKLYDFSQRCWTDFTGKPTSVPAASAA
jgi:omega-6 fatty acid desaturase (delta-12 desaturase)